ncbi:MAG: citrate transporter [Acidobacteriota bacterium]|nr:MAG: citrate transporter [Acidobacteriota bacterium]
MLASLGLFTIISLLALILSRRLSPLAALVLVPVLASLLGGFGLKTGGFIVSGVRGIAPIVGMFVFAILYFGVMKDAGMLDPIIDRILHVIGHHPERVVVGTSLLAALVHLDGSGAVTFLITIPALLPVYERLGMDRRVLACATAMAAGVCNMLPWGGPTIRAAAALHLPVTQIFNPLIPVQIVGLLYVFSVAYWLGKREARRLGVADVSGAAYIRERTEVETALLRPRNFIVNLGLTVSLMVLMISGLVEPVVVFMLGASLALLINYPDAQEQRRRISAHAEAALMMAAILLAAGAFTGILKESGMLEAMAQAAVGQIPSQMGRHIPALLGLLSMPLSLLFDPDSFYFGVLPVVAGIAGKLNVPPVQVAQAALLGQMTTGFPVSPLTPATFLLAGLAKVELGEHQKFTIPFLFGASIVMTLASIAFGIFPW